MKMELITNVSHDLKTPLTSIISYTDLIGREEGLPDTVKDYVQILSQNPTDSRPLSRICLNSAGQQVVTWFCHGTN